MRNKELNVGNIVPHWWYSKVVNSMNRADTMGILLLSDLWFLYRSTGQEEHQKDYDYFCDKFNLSRYQVRETFIRLEALGLMKRRIGNEIVNNRNFANILYVKLNVKQLIEMAPDGLGDDAVVESIFFDDRVGDTKCEDSKLTEAIDNKKNLKEENRSTGSNFAYKKFLNSVSNASPVSSLKADSVLKGHQRHRYSFASFYPLSEADIDELQMLCGREFSGHAINEILKNLSIKLSDRSFPHKAAFIKYMGKALRYEMRQAVCVSNESFRINGNATVQEVAAMGREKFLAEIESSKSTSLVARLKRKLAGILEPSIAYDLLTFGSFVDNVEALDRDCFEIQLSKVLELSEVQKKLILEQVRSVYGGHIKNLSIVLPQDEPVRSLHKDAARSFDGIWGTIRRGLIEYYGTNGNDIDKSWFSKLTADVDGAERKLTLKAPTAFVRDWIQSNYRFLIERICCAHSYSLEEVVLS